MRRLLTAVMACFLLVTVATGCGGKKAEPKADVTVKVVNMAYEPKSVTIKPGQTVEWVFEDGQILHDVQGDDGMTTKLVTSGTYRHTFAKAGTYNYYCSIHTAMTGVVVVAP
jgi:plastocyanin